MNVEAATCFTFSSGLSGPRFQVELYPLPLTIE